MPIAVLVLPLMGAPPVAADEEEVSASISEAVDEALESWAYLAQRGDIEVLDDTFAVGGPQRRQLEAEAIAGVSTSAPTSFVVRELRLRAMASEAATVWARVEASRPGFAAQVLNWDFDLVRSGGRWLVWSVVDAERPAATAIVKSPIPAASVATATTSPAPPTSVADAPVAAREPAESTESGVKLPVLSAWIVVVTFVGVVAAGYLAPRLERRERS